MQRPEKGKTVMSEDNVTNKKNRHSLKTGILSYSLPYHTAHYCRNYNK